MKIKRGSLLEKVQVPFVKHKMKRKDKEIFIEAVILIFIYLFSFVILSLGRVQQKFFGLSEATFSKIQISTLTFVFAVIITILLYSGYKKVYKEVVK